MQVESDRYAPSPVQAMPTIKIVVTSNRRAHDDPQLFPHWYHWPGFEPATLELTTTKLAWHDFSYKYHIIKVILS